MRLEELVLAHDDAGKSRVDEYKFYTAWGRVVFGECVPSSSGAAMEISREGVVVTRKVGCPPICVAPCYGEMVEIAERVALGKRGSVTRCALRTPTICAWPSFRIPCGIEQRLLLLGGGDKQPKEEPNPVEYKSASVSRHGSSRADLVFWFRRLTLAPPPSAVALPWLPHRSLAQRSVHNIMFAPAFPIFPIQRRSCAADVPTRHARSDCMPRADVSAYDRCRPTSPRVGQLGGAGRAARTAIAKDGVATDSS